MHDHALLYLILKYDVDIIEVPGCCCSISQWTILTDARIHSGQHCDHFLTGFYSYNENYFLAVELSHHVTKQFSTKIRQTHIPI